MAIPREIIITFLNVVVDEEALELAGLKRELQNLSKKVDDKYDTIKVQLEAILKIINHSQGSIKPIPKEPLSLEEPIPNEDFSLKTESSKGREQTSEATFQQVVSTKDYEPAFIAPQDEPQVETKEESKEDIKLQPNEANEPQVDCMLFSSYIHSMLLPRQFEGPQNEVYILEFETPIATSSWLNFFKPGECDAGAFYAKKKKKLEDHG